MLLNKFDGLNMLLNKFDSLNMLLNKLDSLNMLLNKLDGYIKGRDFLIVKSVIEKRNTGKV
jgi:hypothetical protein